MSQQQPQQPTQRISAIVREMALAETLLERGEIILALQQRLEQSSAEIARLRAEIDEMAKKISEQPDKS